MSEILKKKVSDVFARLVGRELATVVTLSREVVAFDAATQGSTTTTLVQKVSGVYTRAQDGYDGPVVRQDNRVLLVPASGIKWEPAPGDSVRSGGDTYRIATVDRLGPTPATIVYRLGLQ